MPWFEIDDVGFFDLKEHVFAGKTISLNDLEHRMIRPVFKDPRIHVALVCAAKSCPSIRGEAYIGSNIHSQLDDQSDQFANNEKYVKYDASTKTLILSKILSWHGSDWDEKFPNGGYLQWLNGLVKNPDLNEAISKAIEGKVEVKFFDYDWTLNSQLKPGQAAAHKKSGGFGSGSSPDE